MERQRAGRARRVPGWTVEEGRNACLGLISFVYLPNIVIGVYSI